MENGGVEVVQHSGEEEQPPAEDEQQQDEEEESEQEQARSRKRRKAAIAAAKKKRKRERRARMQQMATLAEEVVQIRQQMQEQNRLIMEQNTLIQQHLKAFQESASRAAAAAAALAGVASLAPNSFRDDAGGRKATAGGSPPRRNADDSTGPEGTSTHGKAPGRRSPGRGVVPLGGCSPVVTPDSARNAGSVANNSGNADSIANISGTAARRVQITPERRVSGTTPPTATTAATTSATTTTITPLQAPPHSHTSELIAVLQRAAAATPLVQAHTGPALFNLQHVPGTPASAIRPCQNGTTPWLNSGGAPASTENERTPVGNERSPEDEEDAGGSPPQGGEDQRPEEAQPSDPGYRVVKTVLGRIMYACGVCERMYTHPAGLQRHRSREHRLNEVVIEPRKRGPPCTSGVRRTRAKKLVITPREKHSMMRKSVKHDFKKRLQLKFSRMEEEERAELDRDKWVEDQLSALWPAWCVVHPQPPPGTVENEIVKTWMEHEKLRDAYEDEMRMQAEAMWKEKPNYGEFPLEEKWWFLRQYLLSRMVVWIAENPYPGDTSGGGNADATATGGDESDDDGQVWSDVRDVAMQVVENVQDELP